MWENILKFSLYNKSGELDFTGKSNEEVEQELANCQIEKINKTNLNNSNKIETRNLERAILGMGNYNYIMTLTVSNLKDEGIEITENKIAQLKKELENAQKETPKEIWMDEINKFETKYKEIMKENNGKWVKKKSK